MAFADTTLIALRESLEAFLILSILAGLVVKLGRPETRRYLYAGAVSALALSLLAGFVIDAALRGFLEVDAFAELFEGVASLVAVAILTYMIVWMYRHTLHLASDLHQRSKRALEAGKPAILFALAFVAVAREGLETVLFFATAAHDTSGAELLLSALIGTAISAVLALLLFTGVVRLNLKKFFAVTGLLLVFFAGGLLATSVHEFTEVGLVPETGVAWTTKSLLDQKSPVGSLVKAVLGYRDSPTYVEAAAYGLYVIGMGAWYARGLLQMRRTPTAAPAKG